MNVTAYLHGLTVVLGAFLPLPPLLPICREARYQVYKPGRGGAEPRSSTLTHAERHKILCPVAERHILTPARLTFFTHTWKEIYPQAQTDKESNFICMKVLTTTTSVLILNSERNTFKPSSEHLPKTPSLQQPSKDLFLSLLSCVFLFPIQSGWSVNPVAPDSKLSRDFVLEGQSSRPGNAAEAGH